MLEEAKYVYRIEIGMLAVCEVLSKGSKEASAGRDGAIDSDGNIWALQIEPVVAPDIIHCLLSICGFLNVVPSCSFTYGAAHTNQSTRIQRLQLQSLCLTN